MPSMNKGIEFETFGSGPLPNTGRYTLYVNDDGTVRLVDDSGNETILGSSASLSGGLTTSDVTAALDVGAIEAGDVVVEGTDLQGFVEQLLLDTFFPTFTNPSVNLTSSLSSNVEAGTISNVTLTANFNRGAITGDLVGGVWNPGTKQDDRAGPANNYTIAGTDNDLDNDLILTSYQVVDGSNSWSTTVDYDQGPQPLDSDGSNYSSPLAAGSVSDSVNVNGRRRAFYGSDSVSSTPYTTSNEVRGLGSSVLNPSNGTSFTINIPIGALMVVFAYPSTLQDVGSVIHVEGLNQNIKDVFNQTTVSVAGANGYSPINYKVYTWVPVSAFTATATHIVTIQED